MRPPARAPGKPDLTVQIPGSAVGLVPGAKAGVGIGAGAVSGAPVGTTSIAILKRKREPGAEIYNFNKGITD